VQVQLSHYEGWTLEEGLISLLRELISIPSFSGEEDKTAGLISAFLSDQGVEWHRKHNNVWAFNRYYNPVLPTVLLNSHHDTVRPASGYTMDPFTPVEKDGKLYGLGSNDAGGALVALLAAFLHFYHRSEMTHNLLFAATAEEEVSGPLGLSTILKDIGPIESAIVGEPTGMRMATSQKGLIVLDCKAHGTAAHVANGNGENAFLFRWFRHSLVRLR
jgi:acetylornithine deacetylase